VRHFEKSDQTGSSFGGQMAGGAVRNSDLVASMMFARILRIV